MKRKSFIVTAVLITLFFAMFMTTCDNPFLPDEEIEESNMSSVSIYSSPSGVSTTATANSITISWNSVSDAAGYYVYRSLSSSGGFTQVGGKIKNTSYTNTGLSAGTLYYYKVAAYNKAGTGPQSSLYSVTTQPNPSFLAPPGIMTTAATANSITITWSAVSNATGYYVYRSSSSSGTYTKVGESLTTSYTNTGLSSGTIYYYKVAAYDKNGAGPQSIFVVAQTQSSSLYTITISGTPKVGQKVTAATSGSGWTGNFNWEYSSSSSASTWYLFTSGTSGLNNSEFVIPAGYVGYYLRVSRQHPSGTWTYSSTGARNFPSNFLGPIQY